MKKRFWGPRATATAVIATVVIGLMTDGVVFVSHVLFIILAVLVIIKIISQERLY